MAKEQVNFRLDGEAKKKAYAVFKQLARIIHKIAVSTCKPLF
jgi:antitoxin component of RelBE/YafQ-DinJ toxin-antitoxin module